MTEFERAAWREQMIADIASTIYCNIEYYGTMETDYLEQKAVELSGRMDDQEAFNRFRDICESWYQQYTDVSLFEEYREMMCAEPYETSNWKILLDARKVDIHSHEPDFIVDYNEIGRRLIDGN